MGTWRRTSAFLRAINLGAKRKFPKAAIVAAVEAAGFTDVETYINTGNVRFDTTLRSRAKIEAALEKAFVAERGFEVPTIVFTPKELRAIAEEAASLRARRPALRLAAQGGADRGRDRGGRGGEHAPTRSPGSAAAPSTCCSARTTTRRS